MCDGRACPLSADCVAKLFVALRERNNRIRLNASLNQYCVSALVRESMLLDLVVKIVLQHNRPESRHRRLVVGCPLSANRRHWSYKKKERLATVSPKLYKTNAV